MHILVIYCHPARDSQTAKLLHRVVQRATDLGHELVVCDLYAEEFDPVLSACDFAIYHDVMANTAKVERYVEDLRAAEGVIMVYPTWWYGMPAMLKGYLDRVWLPGVAFDLDDRQRVTTEALSRIRRFMVITTYGAPWAWIHLHMGDPGRKQVLRGLRRLFSPRCRARWLALYGMDTATRQRREAFEDRVEKAVAMFGR